MLKNKLFKNWMAVTLIALQLSGLFPSSAQGAPVPIARPASKIQIADFHVPERLGRVQTRSNAKSGKTLIVIEDAHASADAQKSIWKLIEDIRARYGSFVLHLEGLSETPNLALEHSFPDRDWLRKKIESDVESQNIGGGAAALILSDKLIPQSAEDRKLYLKAVRLYQSALKSQSLVLARLNRAQEVITRSKQKSYPAEAQSWDKYLTDDSLSGLQFILEAPASRLLKQYPHLHSVRKQVQIQSFLKRPAVMRFWQGFLDRRAPAGLKEEFRSGSVSVSQSAQKMEASLSDVAVSKFNNLEKRLYLFALNAEKSWKEIKTAELASEYQHFFISKLTSLFTKSAQHLLLKQTLRIRLLEKLVRMELSWADWRAVKRMNLESPEWQVFKDFYKVQFGREEKMQKHIAASFHSSKTVVFVSGGFHKQGLEQIAKKQGWNFAVITPNTISLEGADRYAELMQGNVEWKSHMKEVKGQIDLQKAYWSYLVQAYAKDHPNQIYDLLLNWRKQLIFKLADQKQLHQAAKVSEPIHKWLADFMPELSKQKFRTEWLKLQNLQAQTGAKALPASMTQSPFLVPFGFVPADLMSQTVHNDRQISNLGRVSALKEETWDQAVQAVAHDRFYSEKAEKIIQAWQRIRSSFLFESLVSKGLDAWIQKNLILLPREYRIYWVGMQKVFALTVSAFLGIGFLFLLDGDRFEQLRQGFVAGAVAAIFGVGVHWMGRALNSAADLYDFFAAYRHEVESTAREIESRDQEPSHQLSELKSERNVMRSEMRSDDFTLRGRDAKGIEQKKIDESLSVIRGLDEDVTVTWVIPAYNETERLRKKSEKYPAGENAFRAKVRQLKELRKTNPKFHWRMILVDDGSPDLRTFKMLTRMRKWMKLDPQQVQVIRLDPSQKKGPKGGAVNLGMQKALEFNPARGAHFIGYTDMDLSTNLLLTGLMLGHIDAEGSNVAIGVRRGKGSYTEGRNWQAKLSSFLYNLAIRFLLPPLRNIKDTQAGFKLFYRLILEAHLSQQTDFGFSFDAELLLIAKLGKARVSQVPLAWFDSVSASQFAPQAVNRGFEALRTVWNLHRKHLTDYKKLHRDIRKIEIALEPVNKTWQKIFATFRDHPNWITDYLYATRNRLGSWKWLLIENQNLEEDLKEYVGYFDELEKRLSLLADPEQKNQRDKWLEQVELKKMTPDYFTAFAYVERLKQLDSLDYPKLTPYLEFREKLRESRRIIMPVLDEIRQNPILKNTRSFSLKDSHRSEARAVHEVTEKRKVAIRQIFPEAQFFAGFDALQDVTFWIDTNKNMHVVKFSARHGGEELGDSDPAGDSFYHSVNDSQGDLVSAAFLRFSGEHVVIFHRDLAIDEHDQLFMHEQEMHSLQKSKRMTLPELPLVVQASIKEALKFDGIQRINYFSLRGLGDLDKFKSKTYGQSLDAIDLLLGSKFRRKLDLNSLIFFAAIMRRGREYVEAERYVPEWTSQPDASFEVVPEDLRGLHMHVADQVVYAARVWPLATEIGILFEGKFANARSILQLILLGAGPSSSRRLRVVAHGPQAHEAAVKIAQILNPNSKIKRSEARGIEEGKAYIVQGAKKNNLSRATSAVNGRHLGGDEGRVRSDTRENRSEVNTTLKGMNYTLTDLRTLKEAVMDAFESSQIKRRELKESMNLILAAAVRLYILGRPAEAFAHEVAEELAKVGQTVDVKRILKNVRRTQRIYGPFARIDPGYVRADMSSLLRSEGLRRYVADKIGEKGRGGKLLSIGVGIGILEDDLIKRYQVEVTGTDVMPEFLQIINQSVGVRSRIRTVVAHGELLPFEKQSYDTVIYPESIGHLDLKSAVQDAARVLKPGGSIFIMTYSPKSKLAEEFQYNQFSKSEIEEALADSGFKDIAFEMTDRKKDYWVISAVKSQRSEMRQIQDLKQLMEMDFKEASRLIAEAKEPLAVYVARHWNSGALLTPMEYRLIPHRGRIGTAGEIEWDDSGKLKTNAKPLTRGHFFVDRKGRWIYFPASVNDEITEYWREYGDFKQAVVQMPDTPAFLKTSLIEPEIRYFDSSVSRVVLKVSESAFNQNGTSRMAFDRVANQLTHDGRIVPFDGTSRFQHEKLNAAAFAKTYTDQHSDQKVAANLPNGNLGYNAWYLGYSNGRLYHLANEPVEDRIYDMLVTHKNGAMSVESLKFRKQGDRWQALGEGGQDITADVESAVYGPRIVRDGYDFVNTVAEQFDDLRHVLRFPMFTRGNRQIHFGFSDGKGELYKDREKIRRAVRGEVIDLSLEPFRTLGITDKERDDTFYLWGYKNVTHSKNHQELEAGEYLIWDNRMYIRFLPGVHPHSLFGIMKDGGLFTAVVQGNTHHSGTTLHDLARSMIQQGARDVFVWGNGKDSFMEVNGETVTATQARGDGLTSLLITQPSKARSEMRVRGVSALDERPEAVQEMERLQKLEKTLNLPDESSFFWLINLFYAFRIWVRSWFSPQEFTISVPRSEESSFGASKFLSERDSFWYYQEKMDHPIIFPAWGSLSSINRIANAPSNHLIFNDIQYQIHGNKVFIKEYGLPKKDIFFSELEKNPHFDQAVVTVLEHKQNSRMEWITYQMRLQSGEIKKITFTTGDILNFVPEDLGLKKIGMVYATTMGLSNSLGNSRVFWIKMYSILKGEGVVFEWYQPRFSALDPMIYSAYRNNYQSDEYVLFERISESDPIYRVIHGKEINSLVSLEKRKIQVKSRSEARREIGTEDIDGWLGRLETLMNSTDPIVPRKLNAVTRDIKTKLEDDDQSRNKKLKRKENKISLLDHSRYLSRGPGKDRLSQASVNRLQKLLESDYAKLANHDVKWLKSLIKKRGDSPTEAEDKKFGQFSQMEILDLHHLLDSHLKMISKEEAAWLQTMLALAIAILAVNSPKLDQLWRLDKLAQQFNKRYSQHSWGWSAVLLMVVALNQFTLDSAFNALMRLSGNGTKLPGEYGYRMSAMTLALLAMHIPSNLNNEVDYDLYPIRSLNKAVEALKNPELKDVAPELREELLMNIRIGLTLFVYASRQFWESPRPVVYKLRKWLVENRAVVKEAFDVWALPGASNLRIQPGSQVAWLVNEIFDHNHSLPAYPVSLDRVILNPFNREWDDFRKFVLTRPLSRELFQMILAKTATQADIDSAFRKILTSFIDDLLSLEATELPVGLDRVHDGLLASIAEDAAPRFWDKDSPYSSANFRWAQIYEKLTHHLSLTGVDIAVIGKGQERIYKNFTGLKNYFGKVHVVEPQTSVSDQKRADDAIKLYKLEGTKIPLTDESLDVVVFDQTLSDLVSMGISQETLLREAVRVLKPRGWLFIKPGNEQPASEDPRFKEQESISTQLDQLKIPYAVARHEEVPTFIIGYKPESSEQRSDPPSGAKDGSVAEPKARAEMRTSVHPKKFMGTNDRQLSEAEEAALLIEMKKQGPLPIVEAPPAAEVERVFRLFESDAKVTQDDLEVIIRQAVYESWEALLKHAGPYMGETASWSVHNGKWASDQYPATHLAGIQFRNPILYLSADFMVGWCTSSSLSFHRSLYSLSAGKIRSTIHGASLVFGGHLRHVVQVVQYPGLQPIYVDVTGRQLESDAMYRDIDSIPGARPLFNELFENGYVRLTPENAEKIGLIFRRGQAREEGSDYDVLTRFRTLQTGYTSHDYTPLQEYGHEYFHEMTPEIARERSALDEAYAPELDRDFSGKKITGMWPLNPVVQVVEQIVEAIAGVELKATDLNQTNNQNIKNIDWMAELMDWRIPMMLCGFLGIVVSVLSLIFNGVSLLRLIPLAMSVFGFTALGVPFFIKIKNLYRSGGAFDSEFNQSDSPVHSPESSDRSEVRIQDADIAQLPDQEIFKSAVQVIQNFAKRRESILAEGNLVVMPMESYFQPHEWKYVEEARRRTVDRDHWSIEEMIYNAWSGKGEKKLILNSTAHQISLDMMALQMLGWTTFLIHENPDIFFNQVEETLSMIQSREQGGSGIIFFRNPVLFLNYLGSSFNPPKNYERSTRQAALLSNERRRNDAVFSALMTAAHVQHGFDDPFDIRGLLKHLTHISEFYLDEVRKQDAGNKKVRLQLAEALLAGFVQYPKQFTEFDPNFFKRYIEDGQERVPQEAVYWEYLNRLRDAFSDQNVIDALLHDFDEIKKIYERTSYNPRLNHIKFTVSYFNRWVYDMIRSEKEFTALSPFSLDYIFSGLDIPESAVPSAIKFQQQSFSYKNNRDKKSIDEKFNLLIRLLRIRAEARGIEEGKACIVQGAKKNNLSRATSAVNGRHLGGDEGRVRSEMRQEDISAALAPIQALTTDSGSFALANHQSLDVIIDSFADLSGTQRSILSRTVGFLAHLNSDAAADGVRKVFSLWPKGRNELILTKDGNYMAIGELLPVLFIPSVLERLNNEDYQKYLSLADYGTTLGSNHYSDALPVISRQFPDQAAAAWELAMKVALTAFKYEEQRGKGRENAVDSTGYDPISGAVYFVKRLLPFARRKVTRDEFNAFLLHFAKDNPTLRYGADEYLTILAEKVDGSIADVFDQAFAQLKKEPKNSDISISLIELAKFLNPRESLQRMNDVALFMRQTSDVNVNSLVVHQMGLTLGAMARRTMSDEALKPALDDLFRSAVRGFETATTEAQRHAAVKIIDGIVQGQISEQTAQQEFVAISGMVQFAWPSWQDKDLAFEVLTFMAKRISKADSHLFEAFFTALNSYREQNKKHDALDELKRIVMTNPEQATIFFESQLLFILSDTDFSDKQRAAMLDSLVPFALGVRSKASAGRLFALTELIKILHPGVKVSVYMNQQLVLNPFVASLYDALLEQSKILERKYSKRYQIKIRVYPGRAIEMRLSEIGKEYGRFVSAQYVLKLSVNFEAVGAVKSTLKLTWDLAGDMHQYAADLKNLVDAVAGQIELHRRDFGIDFVEISQPEWLNTARKLEAIAAGASDSVKALRSVLTYDRDANNLRDGADSTTRIALTAPAVLALPNISEVRTKPAPPWELPLRTSSGKSFADIFKEKATAGEHPVSRIEFRDYNDMQRMFMTLDQVWNHLMNPQPISWPTHLADLGIYEKKDAEDLKQWSWVELQRAIYPEMKDGMYGSQRTLSDRMSEIEKHSTDFAHYIRYPIQLQGVIEYLAQQPGLNTSLSIESWKAMVHSLNLEREFFRRWNSTINEDWHAGSAGVSTDGFAAFLKQQLELTEKYHSGRQAGYLYFFGGDESRILFEGSRFETKGAEVGEKIPVSVKGPMNVYISLTTKPTLDIHIGSGIDGGRKLNSEEENEIVGAARWLFEALRKNGLSDDQIRQASFYVNLRSFNHIIPAKPANLIDLANALARSDPPRDGSGSKSRAEMRTDLNEGAIVRELHQPEEDLLADDIYRQYPQLLKIVLAWKEFLMRFPDRARPFQKVSDGGIFAQSPFEWIQLTANHLKLGPSDRILDVGSGNGLVAFAFHILTGAEVVSVEMDKERYEVLQAFIQFLKESKGIQYPKVHFENKDFTHLSLKGFKLIYFYFTEPKGREYLWGETIVDFLQDNMDIGSHFASPGFYLYSEREKILVKETNRAGFFRQKNLNYEELKLPQIGLSTTNSAILLTRRSETRGSTSSGQVRKPNDGKSYIVQSATTDGLRGTVSRSASRSEMRGRNNLPLFTARPFVKWNAWFMMADIMKWLGAKPGAGGLTQAWADFYFTYLPDWFIYYSSNFFGTIFFIGVLNHYDDTLFSKRHPFISLGIKFAVGGVMNIYFETRIAAGNVDRMDIASGFIGAFLYVSALVLKTYREKIPAMNANTARSEMRLPGQEEAVSDDPSGETEVYLYTKQQMDGLIHQIKKYRINVDELVRVLSEKKIEDMVREVFRDSIACHPKIGNVDVETRLRIIERFLDAGLYNIEPLASKHANGRLLLSGANTVAGWIASQKHARPQMVVSHLVYNLQGAEEALRFNPEIDQVSVNYLFSSDKRNQALDDYNNKKFQTVQLPVIRWVKGINETIRKQRPIKIAVNFSNAWGLLERGDVSSETVLDWVQVFVNAGVSSIVLSDNPSFSDPQSMLDLIALIRNKFPDLQIGVHVHDDGDGVVTALAGLSAGVVIFETSVGNLGRAFFKNRGEGVGYPGNLSTEDFIFVLKALGAKTEIDLDGVSHVTRYLAELLEDDFTKSRRSFGVYRLSSSERQNLEDYFRAQLGLPRKTRSEMRTNRLQTADDRHPTSQVVRTTSEESFQRPRGDDEVRFRVWLEEQMAVDTEEMVRVAQQAVEVLTRIRAFWKEGLMRWQRAISSREIQKTAPVIFYSREIEDQLIEFIRSTQDSFDSAYPGQAAKHYRFSLVFLDERQKEAFVAKHGKMAGVQYYTLATIDFLETDIFNSQDWKQHYGVFGFDSELQAVAWQRNLATALLPSELAFALIPDAMAFFSVTQTDQIELTLASGLMRWIQHLQIRKNQGIFVLSTILEFFSATTRRVMTSA